MFRIKGFLPYILIIFFNSFVDLGHKILIQNTLYTTESATHFSLMSSIVNALILLPYILLFTPTGFIADKFAKVKVLRATAIAAIPLTMTATWCYYQGYFHLAFALTLALAVQSAVNSPAKYGYIKEIFGKGNIAKANAFVQATAIISILAGTFIFSIIFNHYVDAAALKHSTNKALVLKAFAPAGFVLIAMSIFESICTFIIPKKAAVDPNSEYHVKKYIRGAYMMSYLKEVRATPIILICILGLSVFWGINQVLLASYGAYLKAFAGDPSTVYVNGALGLGGIGVLLGALYAGNVSKGYIESGMIPIAAIGFAIALLIMPHAINHVFILVLFLIYGVFGGMYLVSLNSLIQFNAKDKNLGKVLAANNFVQTIFMLTLLILNIVYASLGYDIRYFLYGLSALAVATAIYAFITLPQATMRYLVYFIFSRIYNMRVEGLNNLPSSGGILLLGNHVSFLDWALIQLACPRMIRFVIDKSYYQKWYFRWFFTRLKMISISTQGSKEGLNAIKDALNEGDVVALFPEGRLSKNGQLGEFRPGFERAVNETQAQIVPFYLCGLWGSKLTYATEAFKQVSKRHRRRDVSVTFGLSLRATSKAQEVKQEVRQLSIHAWKEYIDHFGAIPNEWLRQVKQSPGAWCITESSGITLTKIKLAAVAFNIRRFIKNKIKKENNIGIILPAGIGSAVANLACFCLGKTVVNLNYTSHIDALLYAEKSAELKTIITSKKFINRLAQKGFDLSQLFNMTKVIYLEDCQSKIRHVEIASYLFLLRALPLSLLSVIFVKKIKQNDTAAILFSSGSEGAPKGVKLSHKNIIGNIKQASSVFNLQRRDVVLSTLPVFHAFGLTVTTLMPLIEGLPMACHPDPTDVLNIAKLIFREKVTLMCGTSTFFGLYNRNRRVLPQMLASLRLVIAGAEKLSPKVAEMFQQKFNQTIYEGYGTTEVAPVASANLPDVLDATDWHLHVANKNGTVGLPLPGTAFRIVDPDSLEDLSVGDEGMVLIGGTQVMQGYLNNQEKTKQVLIPDGDITWYVTGDKGRLDEAGFLTIVDRYSRFAKIGGEMISLSQVESVILETLGKTEIEVMAVAIADEQKGERIILLHTGDLTNLRDKLKQKGVSNLMLPSQLIVIEEIPKLGTGKRDYVNAKRIALKRSQNL